jgi:ATP-dependent helicase HrpA
MQEKGVPLAGQAAAQGPAPLSFPELVFPESLPVSGKREEIAQAIALHPVVIVCGETGSGKTTQLPKIAWMAGRGRKGLIGHTQPRRLAATSVAKRIAQELGSPLGEHVGFKIRFNEQSSGTARLKLMTDGILLAESLRDRELRAYDTIIVDEAHERSLNIDFLLGYLKQLIEGPRKDSLKLIITSATIDAERFARHFGSAEKPAPVIEVSGRMFPVEIRYAPLDAEPPQAVSDNDADGGEVERADSFEMSLPEAIENAITGLWREQPGDALVFLPGEREIRDVQEHLRKVFALGSNQKRAYLSGPVEVLPLYARLSAGEQDKIFSAGNGRRIVLATNVAETSLTVPGIRYVIDSGLARVKRYRYRQKVEQLQIEPISQAAANQRAGRCGRVQDGICVRLYDEQGFVRRPKFTDPEVLRSSLAGVILRMKALKLTEVEQFPFLDPPPRRAIADGYELLDELNAVDRERRLTPIGKQLSSLPLDPRIGRMLLAAQERACLDDVLTIAAALSVQDPRERPLDAQQAADQRHLRFADERSDFLAILKLWAYVRSAHSKISNKARADQFKREFLSPRRLREWAEVRQQLEQAMQQALPALSPGRVPPTARVSAEVASTEKLDAAEGGIDARRAEAIHRALLAGLLGNLGLKATEGPHYLGTHEVKFLIHPGSGLAKKGGRWLMAAELVDTGRLYARMVARVDPVWIEQAALHLVKKTLAEPHWEKKAAQVIALERGVLYGLPIYAGRRVNFGQKNPQQARELMIRAALVEGEWETRLAFVTSNRKLVKEVQALEQKLRRPDLLVDDEFLFAFYDAKLAQGLTSGQQIEHWIAQLSRAEQEPLFLKREELLRKQADGVSSENFPRSLTMRGVDYELDYVFEPGDPKDGVTLKVPLQLLNQVDASLSDWLVPGMLADRVVALLKSLPPRARHRCLPHAQYAQDFIARCQRFELVGQRPLAEVLRDDLREQIQLPVAPTDFKLEQVPPHLSMRFVVQDEYGRELGAARSMSALRAQFGQMAQTAFKQLGAEAIAPSSLPASASDSNKPHSGVLAGKSTQWSFGTLAEMMELPGPGGSTVFGYPSLVDMGDAVQLQVFDEPVEAQRMHEAGLLRLFALQMRDTLKFMDRSLPGLRDMALQFQSLGTEAELKAQMIDVALRRVCLASPLPTDEASFIARVAQARGRVGLVAQEVARICGQVLTQFSGLNRKLLGAKAMGALHADIQAQVQLLVHKRFLSETPWASLAHVPRYLQAASLRIDKARNDPARDARLLQEFSPLLSQWQRAIAQQRSQRGTAVGLAPDERLVEYRWLLEELRVALFAQELRTPQPASVKRLQKAWDSLRQAGVV